MVCIMHFCEHICNVICKVHIFMMISYLDFLCVEADTFQHILTAPMRQLCFWHFWFCECSSAEVPIDAETNVWTGLIKDSCQIGAGKEKLNLQNSQYSQFKTKLWSQYCQKRTYMPEWWTVADVEASMCDLLSYKCLVLARMNCWKS